MDFCAGHWGTCSVVFFFPLSDVTHFSESEGDWNGGVSGDCKALRLYKPKDPSCVDNKEN